MEDLRFLLEPRAELGQEGSGREDFQGDHAALALGQVDDAHAAAADLLQEAIGPDPRLTRRRQLDERFAAVQRLVERMRALAGHEQELQNLTIERLVPEASGR